MEKITKKYHIQLGSDTDVSYFFHYLNLAASDNNCLLKKLVLDYDSHHIAFTILGLEIAILTIEQLLDHRGYKYEAAS